ncbi:MAG: glycosyltransferase family 4 protein [Deltaproteobacteria bacterium]|nr:glycosyltransferase family 4 protein [Deltaproteobacteria bacterium]MBW2200215.1 glycosyltransferase family 4 protein [Deltaproteobacteria bacterium]MBW2538772.1 glycosyltransferase family 4 protein [Deltaproteobacteria bacterium]
MTNGEAPLRICLLSYRSNPHCGGQGVYIKNLSEGLKNRGHRVDVVSGPPDAQLDDGINVFQLPCLDLYNPEDLFRMPTLKELCSPVNLIEWLGVSTTGFPEPFTFGLRAYQFLRDKIHSYDIVHDNQSLSYGIWAIGKFVPTIATIHHPVTVDRDLAVRAASTFWEKIKQMRWHSFIKMQKMVARTFSRIITVSERAQRDISKDFYIPEQNFRIIPNGINTRLFYPATGIEREKNRIIVTNSSDTPLKGLYFLLLAVSKLIVTRRLRLIVVGTPNKNGEILKLIRTLGIENSVTFTGPIDNQEFVTQYAQATVAVVPSVYEGFGLPAGEAMACGVPVICTTGGALPEVVGDAGILVPPADHEALAKAITILLDNPDRAKYYGQAGYNRVQTHFTWEKAVEKTVKAYREVIRDHSRF